MWMMMGLVNLIVARTSKPLFHPTAVPEKVTLYSSAVDWVLKRHLLGCFVTFLTSEDDFADMITPNFISLMVANQLPYQVTLMDKDGYPSTDINWRTTSCNVYIIVTKMANQEGRKIVVYTFNSPPSLYANVGEDDVLTNIAGPDYMLLEALADALNFRPQYLQVGPTKWLGVVNRIKNGEGEIGIANLFIVESRAKLVAFTTPYDFVTSCFITPAPRELPRWLAVVFPFNFQVWILLTVSVVLMAIVVRVFGAGLVTRDLSILHQVSGALMVVVAYFCNQSSVKPLIMPMKVLLGVIMISGFITSIYYSSNLTAYMMVKAVEKPYTTIKQIGESDLKVLGFGPLWREILNASIDENIRRIAPKYTPVMDVTGHIKFVVSREAAILSSDGYLEYMVSTYYTNNIGESPIRMMNEECLNTYGVGAVLQHHSPILPALNKVIQRLFEVGLLKLLREQKPALDRHVVYAADYLGYDKNVITLTSSLQSLSLLHMQGSFLVLGVGLVAAILTFLLEVLSTTYCPFLRVCLND